MVIWGLISLWWCKKQLILERDEWESDNGVVEKVATSGAGSAADTGVDVEASAGINATGDANGRADANGAEKVDELDARRLEDNVSPGTRPPVVSSPLAMELDDGRGRSPPPVS
jgi:hypothetical protein